MEKELSEIKEKVLDFCKKYNLKEFDIVTTEVTDFIKEKSIISDISIKIEV